MKKTVNQLIANQLCQAQCASDAGKFVYRLKGDGMNYRHARRYGYAAKAGHIINALRLCDSVSECGFKYWVTDCVDQNGCASVLVYFSFKYEGKRHQVSFHTPMMEAELTGLSDWVGKGMKQRWGRGSSYLSAIYLEKIATGG